MFPVTKPYWVAGGQEQDAFSRTLLVFLFALQTVIDTIRKLQIYAPILKLGLVSAYGTRQEPNVALDTITLCYV